MIFLLVFFVLPVFSGESVDDVHTYKPGDKREYIVKGKNLRVCASIIDSNAENLEEQCGGAFGDCLDIIDVKTLSKRASGNRKSIKADYIGLSGNALTFEVVNKTTKNHEIQVTAFDPNYLIDKVLEFPPYSTQTFKLASSHPLYVYAGIDIKHHYSLRKHCKKKFGCLKFEEYWRDKWVAQTSGRGIGRELNPDNDGMVKFKITNDHSISTKIILYVRSSDYGACNI